MSAIALKWMSLTPKEQLTFAQEGLALLEKRMASAPPTPEVALEPKKPAKKKG